MTELKGSGVKEAEGTKQLAVSVDEAGRLLGVSRDLVYDLVARRELASVRLGRRIVVPMRALEEMLGRAAEGRGPDESETV